MDTDTIFSLKRYFIISITGLAFVLFGLAAATTSYFGIQHIHNEFKKNIIEATHFIGQLSEHSLIDADTASVEKKLAFLSQLSAYNTVHVYHTENDVVTSMSSYNKDYTGNMGFKQIASQYHRKAQLQQPVITGKIIEYIEPVTHNDQTIGYIYVQQDISLLFELQNKVIIITALAMLLVIACFIYLATFLHKKSSSAIKNITATIQQISSQKAFDLRCQQQESQEFEFLARNINSLLARIQRHIKKQEDAEQQIIKLNHELEDRINQRTNALKDSNEELLSTLEKLHQFQGQLVESEKMASLGDMVAGVAHEVNTPIGLGVTASTLLADKLNEIKVAYEDKTLKSSQLRKFLTEGEENIAIIYRNLTRAAELISSFKRVAVDQSNEEDRKFFVDKLINEVLLTLAPQLRQHSANINIECPKNLLVTSKPGPLKPNFN